VNIYINTQKLHDALYIYRSNNAGNVYALFNGKSLILSCDGFSDIKIPIGLMPDEDQLPCQWVMSCDDVANVAITLNSYCDCKLKNSNYPKRLIATKTNHLPDSSISISAKNQPIQFYFPSTHIKNDTAA
jgi:hypothetical protein